MKLTKSQLREIIKQKILNEDLAFLKETQKLNQLPKGKIFDDAKNIEGIFKKSKRSWGEVIKTFEKYKEHQQPTTINIRNIKITQPNIQANKVKNMLDKIDKLPPINVIEFEDGEKVIYDGHHRLVANWVLGRNKIKVNLIRITINYNIMKLKENNNPDLDKKVKSFVATISKRYGIPTSHAKFAILRSLNKINEDNTYTTLRNIIRTELREVNITEGDFVSYFEEYKGKKIPMFIQYIDSTHVKVTNTKPKKGERVSGFVAHIRQLSHRPYYNDMIKWMKTGDKKHIDGKVYSEN